jgi:hypothetical protein
MATTDILKPNLVDDPDPNTVPPPGNRVFDVQLFAPNGHMNNRSVFRGRAIGASGAPVPTASFASTSLYLFVGGQWQLAGDPVLGLVQGQNASTLYGIEGSVVSGYLRMTGIVAPGAFGIVQSINDADQSTFVARNQAGSVTIAYAQPGNWQTLAPFAVPAGGFPASITGGVSYPVQEYVLLKHQAVPAGTIYLTDATAVAGDGFQLQAGESVEWPAKDVAEIFAFADAPGRVLLITRF